MRGLLDLPEEERRRLDEAFKKFKELEMLNEGLEKGREEVLEVIRKYYKVSKGWTFSLLTEKKVD